LKRTGLGEVNRDVKQIAIVSPVERAAHVKERELLSIHQTC